MNTPTHPVLTWTEGGQPHTARWRSEAGVPPPKRVRVVDDTLNADTAFRLASEGNALLWRGDFQNARQLLQALARRVEAKPKPKRADANKPPPALVDAFNQHRQAQSQRARTLGMLLIPLDAEHRVPLRRAADMHAACTEVWGPGDGQPSVASLRELLGLIGAHEWRKKGVPIEALGGEHIHPHYGVFSPVRGEYVDLVAKFELPRDRELAFDIGTGTGVLAALLARRGVKRVIATDSDPRALACARENLTRLKVSDRVELLQADLFPEGRAPLVLCNPPWLPARPSSPIEHAIYDHESRMLRGYLDGLAAHLTPGGEGWLILSDLAEHLGLRPREQLMGWIEAAGLRVAGRLDTRPRHPKTVDRSDPLHVARAQEVTSLWRLVAGPKAAG
ncbi:methyltransferase [Rivibacter subsaxonicus]|uniref:Methylase of polypeptide subunit release factors n=1 Tax=Rivibacter subsaxonicus TaxID=457575 RepID=A0A4Q7W0F0_9BURK|nr:class I SAM-dependent methyltransferase [Rivibacter subsaxonicus]RZU02473.1 methylase of polypeptide subunit release factors [Rivibacter subsaxonicus]